MSANITTLLSRYAVEKREAEMLIAHVLGVSRASIISHPERLLGAAEEQSIGKLLARRANGEPIAYLIGRREFYGRDLTVSPATLIPRPETELIVDLALARITDTLSRVNRAGARVSQPGVSQNAPAPLVSPTRISSHIPNVLDLGTGSGAIAVSIALECEDAIVVATDVSRDALTVAADNARRLRANVVFIESSWYANLQGRKFSLIVSNPPYVASGDIHLSQGDLRFEPQIALTDASPDGLCSIRNIVEGAPAHLNAGGWLLFEHGYDQADAARELLLKAGFENLTSVNDLAGIPRVAGGQIR